MSTCGQACPIPSPARTTVLGPLPPPPAARPTRQRGATDHYRACSGWPSTRAARRPGAPPGPSTSGWPTRTTTSTGRPTAGGKDTGTYGLWHSTDSGASLGKLAAVDKADTIGFGKSAPGATYPALYSSAQIGGVRGIFRSDDAGGSWVRINDDSHQWGWRGAAITGDPRVYGRVYTYAVSGQWSGWLRRLGHRQEHRQHGAHRLDPQVGVRQRPADHLALERRLHPERSQRHRHQPELQRQPGGRGRQHILRLQRQLERQQHQPGRLHAQRSVLHRQVK
ncbi:hypothetical protein FB465_5732 [Kitasatospora atroaurantiaca]|uniref:Uncharacterized protein n=1 Tax=Kitasatospora atroaurantiaca TaxID=285545 RepID=A0A561EY91_9ACTN|nr:hypothetical protein FB465_5732 [Kitasatospora atroaurantiaca]